MNKKGGLIGLAIVMIFVILLIWFIIIPFIDSMIEERENYKELQEFCEDRPDFCYCEYLECNFMIKYTNGRPSRDTRDYCKIVVEQEDKRAIFQGRCE